MVLKILISRILARFCLILLLFLNFFNISCPFLSLTIITGQQIFLSLGDEFLNGTFVAKNDFEVFIYCEVENFFNFALLVFFLCDLFTNKARELEVAEPYLIMKNISISFCLCRLGFLFFCLSFTLSLSLSLSLSI